MDTMELDLSVELPEPMRLVVPLAMLPPDEELIGPEPTPAFVESVRWLGVTHEITLVDGESYTVVDGRRRIKAARKAGRESALRAAVYPAGTPVAQILSLLLNNQRGSNLASDLDALDALPPDLAPHDIVRLTGIPMQRLRVLQKLRALHPTLRKALADGALAQTTALAAAKLSPSDQAVLADLYERGGRVTGADVKEIRQARAAEAAESLPESLFGTPPAPEPESRQHTGEAGVPEAEFIRWLWNTRPDFMRDAQQEYDLEQGQEPERAA